MLANTSLLPRPAQDKPGSDRPAPLPALRRGTQLPAPAAARSDGLPSGEPAAVPAALLDYAAFVLDQEARYCQQ